MTRSDIELDGFGTRAARSDTELDDIGKRNRDEGKGEINNGIKQRQ